jgi:pimeloyl-ACP methyl ester carboxylesterase
MIKLTRVHSEKDNAPKLFVIPGGPGLSSNTLRDLDLLKRSFELVYIDIQGTNGSAYTGKKTFSEIGSSLAEIVSNESGQKFSLGHSFGGFWASDLLIRGLVSGLVCISTPFTRGSLSAVNDNYNLLKTAALTQAENEWSKNQDDSSFAKWLSEFGLLYFKSPKGKEIILNDKVSSKFFKDNRSDAMDMEPMLSSLSRIEGTKIFISGKEDRLLPVDLLQNDARIGNFDFYQIEEASHFVTIDQPVMASKIIETKLMKG